MDDGMLEALKKLAMAAMGDNDASKWPQVGKLTPDEMRDRRNFDNKNEKWQSELQMLKDKAVLIVQEQKIAHREFWTRIEEAHSLPRKRNHHLTEDGRILMEPAKKSKKEKTDE